MLLTLSIMANSNSNGPAMTNLNLALRLTLETKGARLESFWPLYSGANGACQNRPNQ